MNSQPSFKMALGLAMTTALIGTCNMASAKDADAEPSWAFKLTPSLYATQNEANAA